MPPPLVPRRVCCRLTVRGFRPIGQPACKAGPVTIGLDEIEAIRLADVEGLYQAAAAEHMGVSRQTYARILTRARTAVARCLLEGRMLLVESRREDPVVAAALPATPCPVHGGHRRGRKCHCPDVGRGCSGSCGQGRCGCPS